MCVTVWQLLYYYGNYYAVRVPLLAGIAGRLLPPSLCRSSGQSSDNYTLLLLLLQRATVHILNFTISTAVVKIFVFTIEMIQH